MPTTHDTTTGTAPIDDDAIRSTIASAERHQNDVEPFLALHTDATVIVNIAGRRILGRDALRTAMTAAVASPLADVTTTIDVLDVRLLRPDVALVSCVKHVTDGRSPAARADGADDLPAEGSLTYVLVRDDGTWRIALAQTTPQRA
jgi:uncharacterized protein (TIGR02246 family)